MTPSPARTKLTRHVDPLGSWCRAVCAPDSRLRPFLRREHVGYSHDAIGFESWLEPPQPAVTLMISLEKPLRTERGVLPQAWIAGLDDRPEVVAVGGRDAGLDLKLSPLGAYALFGLPMSELSRRVVPLEEIAGRPTGSLAEELAGTAGWEARFDRLERLLLRRLSRLADPDPFVATAVSRLEASEGRMRIGQLAAELRVSRRHLAARFRTQVGMPPKAYARLVRFDAVRRRISARPASWADIAADAGYADQSHLNREFRELAGTTPADFVARQLPEGGTVGDGVTFVQDTGGGSP